MVNEEATVFFVCAWGVGEKKREKFGKSKENRHPKKEKKSPKNEKKNKLKKKGKWPPAPAEASTNLFLADGWQVKQRPKTINNPVKIKEKPSKNVVATSR